MHESMVSGLDVESFTDQLCSTPISTVSRGEVGSSSAFAVRFDFDFAPDRGAVPVLYRGMWIELWSARSRAPAVRNVQYGLRSIMEYSTEDGVAERPRA